MAGPIALAAALSRIVTIKCPWCKAEKAVARTSKPVAFRKCARCHKTFPDPLKSKKK
jgi:transposase-like protein